MKLLIRKGRVIDHGQGVDRVTNLLVVDGKVFWPEAGAATGDAEVLDAKGLIVCPGFIDLHCHLRQPGYEAKETIATGSLAAAKGGFTTICCMPNTDPPLDSRSTIDFVKGVAACEGVVRVLPIGCVTRGRRGEGLCDFTELADAGVVGFSDDGSPVANSRLMRLALEGALKLGLPVIDHCEDVSLSADGQVNEGVMSSRLGLGGIPAAAEEIMVARDIAVAALTGGHVHIAHVSTKGSVDLIRQAKEKGINVTAEVTPHHLTLTEDAVAGLNTDAKVSPPLRTKRDVQALVEALREGVIDIIATDHAPHAEADKRCDFTRAASGISGFETALGSLMGLVHDGRLTLHTLITRLTCGPARITGEKYGKLGTLAAGAPADITIFDTDREWVVDPGTFLSKGKNTPLTGATLKGKVMATIFGGKVVYQDDSIEIGKATRRSRA